MSTGRRSAHITTYAWSLLFLLKRAWRQGMCGLECHSHIRKECLVKGAFVELVDAVDGTHGGEIAEDDLVGANADDGTVALKESLHSHALLQASDVGGEPEVRDGRIPRAGDGCQGREAELVYAGGAEEEERREDREEDEVGGGGDAVEDVEVEVEAMAIAMAMAPHLTPLPVNRAMNVENLMVLREGWQVGTALGSQGGVGLSGEWSLLERDEVFCRIRSVKCSSFRLSSYLFDVA